MAPVASRLIEICSSRETGLRAIELCNIILGSPAH